MDTPQVEQVDTRREILEQGFDAAEKGEPIESVARDEAGRFAPKAKVEAPEAPEVPVEPPVWERPPASWKKEYHEVWSKADPRLREYAYQREEQMRRGVEPLLTKAQFADAMNQAIEPYRETIRGLGISEHEAVAAVMKADYTLRTTADPAARAAYFQQLAQSYGVNLGAAPANPQQGIDPMVWQLQNELNKVRGEVMGWKEQQEMVQNQSLLSEIESFSQKVEHFEDARPTMIQLLQSGMAQTLDEAYEKAIRLDSALFERVTAAKQAEAQAKAAAEANRAAKVARAAAVSVRSATPGTNTAPKAATRRAMLEEALADAESRL